jgi:hypothetical protein
VSPTVEIGAAIVALTSVKAAMGYFLLASSGYGQVVVFKWEIDSIPRLEDRK